MVSPSNRFSLKVLMTSIGVTALGLGLMRNGSGLAAKAAFNVLLVALMVALLGAIVRRGDGAWPGFALFGWAYAIFAFVPAVPREFDQGLFAEDFVQAIVSRLNPGPEPEPSPPSFPGGYVFKLRDWRRDLMSSSMFDLDEKLPNLSPDEQKMLKDHLDQLDAHEKLRDTWKDSLRNAASIGHSLLAFVAGLSGAILGRALANQSTPAAGSFEAGTSTRPG